MKKKKYKGETNVKYEKGLFQNGLKRILVITLQMNETNQNSIQLGRNHVPRSQTTLRPMIYL